MPAPTSTSGDIYGGQEIRLNRKMIVEQPDGTPDLPRRAWHIDGFVNSLLQDYRSFTEEGSNRMKIEPRLAVEVYPERLKLILVADLAPQIEAIAWNTENYAESKFRGQVEQTINAGIDCWLTEQHGTVMCCDQERIWQEKM